MFVIGKANEAEIKQMKEQGWVVDDVDQTLFNKALDPNHKPENNADLEEHEDRLVAIYTDQDVSEQASIWHREEQEWVG
jgi:hypothetical protein